MRAKNYLFFNVRNESSIRPSILESSVYMIDIIRYLSDKSKNLKKIEYYHSNKKISLNLNDTNESLSIIIAQQILNKEWSEITSFEDNKKPTVDYRRRLGSGFSGWFSFLDNNGKKLFDCSIGVGYKSDGVVISPASKDVLFEYSWYEEVLTYLIEIMRPYYASVCVSMPSIVEMYKKYDLDCPMGWLTYYSDKFNIRIPELSYASLKKLDEGFIIKSDEADFLFDKESFEAYKSKLDSNLKKLREVNPNRLVWK